MRRCLRLYPNHLLALEDTARYLIGNGMWARRMNLLEIGAEVVISQVFSLLL